MNSLPHKNYTFEKSAELFSRAEKLIPGGIYGHASPALVIPGASPYYAARAKGCRYWDVDDNEWIDYMCGYGPIILGYQHPEIEEAAEKQRRDGDCMNHPGSIMIDLAEKLTSLIDIADWSVFGKNGSDMTTWAIQVARQHTGRKKILKVDGAYHGTHAWCTPGHGGLIPEDRAHIHAFEWNNTESLDHILNQFQNEVAAIIITPFHHPAFSDSILPTPEFLKHLQNRCDQHGIVLILDDVRAGFRVDLHGSHHHFKFSPDIACYSKAIANGYPLSAAVGKQKFKIAASKVFLTGSFWNGTVAMAASLKTIEVLERDQSLAHVAAMGEKLMEGLQLKAQAHGLSIRTSGHPSMPFMTFANETNLYRSQHFARKCLENGVFFHPHHNWFLNAAHTKNDIEETLEIADLAFQSVHETFSN